MTLGRFDFLVEKLNENDGTVMGAGNIFWQCHDRVLKATVYKKEFVMEDQDIVIVSATRSAIGDFGGTLKKVAPLSLAQNIMEQVMGRAAIQPEWIDKVIFGCNFSPIDQNIARDAAYKAQIPYKVPAFTINCACGSSMQAVICAAQSIAADECDIILAGGVESMSNAPYITEYARWGQRMTHATSYDLLWRGMQEPNIGVGMGLTAENLAEKHRISRQEQDEYAVLSHRRAAKAILDKRFSTEITPISIPKKKGAAIVFDTDEHVRPDANLEALAKLSPIFKKNGTVTAGNACSMNDAAAAVIITRREKAAALGLKPMAKIISYHVSGVKPEYMGIGPVPAIQSALDKVRLAVRDIDRYEINEAFAAQYLACEKELRLDRDKVNVNGNGIALGHPIAATGCRLLVTLLYGMLADDLSLGVASLCAGGGLGFAVVLEKI